MWGARHCLDWETVTGALLEMVRESTMIEGKSKDDAIGFHQDGAYSSRIAKEIEPRCSSSCNLKTIGRNNSKSWASNIGKTNLLSRDWGHRESFKEFRKLRLEKGIEIARKSSNHSLQMYGKTRPRPGNTEILGGLYRIDKQPHSPHRHDAAPAILVPSHFLGR